MRHCAVCYGTQIEEWSLLLLISFRSMPCCDFSDCLVTNHTSGFQGLYLPITVHAGEWREAITMEINATNSWTVVAGIETQYTSHLSCRFCKTIWVKILKIALNYKMYIGICANTVCRPLIMQPQSPSTIASLVNTEQLFNTFCFHSSQGSKFY